MPHDRITHEWLRSRGFRLDSHHVDNQPHMVLCLGGKQETAIEITECAVGGWTIWLRSDIAHSRCRFCYMRTVQTTQQLERLVEALTDAPLGAADWDPMQFSDSLAREKEECQRRFAEYCQKNRYGYVPGG